VLLDDLVDDTEGALDDLVQDVERALVDDLVVDDE